MASVMYLRIHWRLYTILKTSSKSIWSNVFWYIKVCIFWKCIPYTMHWDKMQILKKSLQTKQTVQKMVSFLSWAPTHHSFTFNLRSYMSWSKGFGYLKLRVGISISDSVSFLFKVYIFLQQNAWTLWL